MKWIQKEHLPPPVDAHREMEFKGNSLILASDLSLIHLADAFITNTISLLFIFCTTLPGVMHLCDNGKRHFHNM